MSDQWLDKVISRRTQWLLINGHRGVKLITPLVKLIPLIRAVKGSAELAIWVGTAGAERGTFGTVGMRSPEIERYESSALGSSRII